MSILKRNKGGAHLEPKKEKEQAAENAQARQAEEKKPQGKKKRTRKEKIRLAVIIAAIVLAALALLLVIAFAVHQHLVKAPELPSGVAPSLPGSQVSDPGSDGEQLPPPGVGVTGGRKEDFYTFLVVGRDTAGGGNTDTILLAAYDVANQKLNVMSIPRDTMVNESWDLKKINSVYNFNGGGEKGIDALCADVGTLVGFVPDYSVVVEWEAVGELVKAIGGVWYDVPRDMDYDDPTQNLHIHVKAGYQKLDGEAAMGVVRFREGKNGYATGDIGRIETQQGFLKAVVAQCLQIQNVVKIRQFAQIFEDNVTTDLSLGNLVWFAERAIFDGLSMDNVNFITMPGNYGASAWSRSTNNYQSYVLPDGEEILKVVNESFNPYQEDRTADMLDIMSVNKDGSLSSSTGVVKDSRAAVPPVTVSRPAATPEPSPDVTEPPETSDDPSVSPDPNVSQPPEPSGDPNAPGVSEPPETSEPPEASAPPEAGEPPAQPSDGGTPPTQSSDAPPEAQPPIPTPTAWTPPPEVVAP